MSSDTIDDRFPNISYYFVLIFVFIALFFISRFNFLLFHTLAEFFSIIIACTFFLIAWHSKQLMANHYLLFLGIAYLYIGSLDLLHTLAYKGMGVFPGHGANLPTQLWIGARYMESLSLMAAPLFLYKKIRPVQVLFFYALLAVLLLLTVFSGNFPDCFTEGVGLTPFKKVSEYVISFILLGSLALLYHHRHMFKYEVYRLVAFSILLTIGAELAFTFYISVYGFSNIVGHYFKITSFFLVYLAIIRTGLEEPHELIFTDLNKANQKLHEEIAARIQTEKDLIESRAILKTAMDQSPAGIAIADAPDGTLRYVNDAGLMIRGGEREELINGVGISKYVESWQLLDLDGRPLKTDEVPLAHAIIHGKPYSREFIVRRTETDDRIVLGNAAPILNEAGEVIAGIVVFDDITDRKKADEALREKDVMLANIASQVPGMIYQFRMAPDGSYSVPYSSEGVKDIFGCSPEDVHDDFDPIFKAIHPADRDIILQTIDESVRNMSQWKCEYRVQLPGKPLKWVFGNSIPEKRADGSIVWTGYNVDITERKQAEKALQESHERFRTLFENAPLAYQALDENGCFVEVNQTWLKQLGYTREEILGKSFGDFLPGEWKDHFKKNFPRIKAIGEIAGVEFELIRKDGSTILVAFNGKVGRNPDGTFKQLHCVFQDITEQRKLEEQLRQAHKMEAVGTMAGGIAHDFNNILAIITGYAELAQDDIPVENPAQENIDEISKAALRARELVSQILAFSRKEQREVILLHPQTLVKETLKLLRSTTPATVSMNQTISGNCGMIKADPTGLHQLLMNLFNNAVHAMDEKGTVTVSLDEVEVKESDFVQFQYIMPMSYYTEGKYARLSVKDEGAGIDKESIKRIFDPFYTTKDVGKGTGMGLSIVYSIVESHGGFVAVESKPGQGSTFNVHIPLTEEAEEDTVEEEVKVTSLTGTERILLVDDEEGILKMAARMLKNLGYQVTAESNSLKALENFKNDQWQFDLIITDQAMPNMSGVEMVSEIHKLRPDMPVILCTGFSSKISAENAGEKGISKFIHKPYDKKILSQAIREVLNGKV